MTKSQGSVAIALVFMLNFLFLGLNYNNWWAGAVLFVCMGVISELTDTKNNTKNDTKNDTKGASSDDRHE